MAYSDYINTDQIENFDLTAFRWNKQWVEEGGDVYTCQNHGVVLLQNDLYNGGLIFGCENCGYREEWTLATG